ncbi:hypothetical protein GCM10028824_41630 [Hymenobacter segetis]
MNPVEQFPPPLRNVLPLRFRTWVACYDHIPENQRHESHFRFYQGVTKKQFARLYGYPQPPQVIGKVEYLVEREWLLARVGEELLPARWTVTEWQEIRRAVKIAHSLQLSKDALHIGNQAFSRLVKALIDDQQH